MIGLLDRIGILAFVVGLLMLAFPAHAQEAANRPLTIADCPHGYRLGVQETTDPQPVARMPDPNNYVGPGGNLTNDPQADPNAAPRQFITGCIPITPKQ